MDFEQGLATADEVVFLHTGKRLSSVEIEVLRGCWQDETYDQIADKIGYSIGYLNRTVAPRLWQILSDSFGEKTGKKNLRFVIERYLRRQANQPAPSLAVQSSSPTGAIASQFPEEVIAPPSPPVAADPPTPSRPLSPPPSCRVEWGDAMDVSVFYGRQADLELLTQWIGAEHCRLVVLLGMGGIGKTALAVKLAQQLGESGRVGEWEGGRVGERPSPSPSLSPSPPPSLSSSLPPFTFIIWRSLRNAPPLEDLLEDLLSFLSPQSETQPTLGNLLQCLRQSRCLVLLDGLESLLEAGEIGRFREGYEHYSELLRLVGEVAHQSCMVVTSREKLAEVSVLEGIESAVRSLRVEGSPEVVQAIVQGRGLVGTEEQKQQLGKLYGNSPLALKIVATSIQELFEGSIEAFLSEDTLLFNGIRRLLDQHFSRLSPLEQSILYWLAVNREWTTSTELQTDIVPPISKSRLLEALEALSLRSLIERQANRYTLQAAVMEYVVEQFTERLVNELKTAKLSLFLNHAILKATAEESIRASQQTFILENIASQLNRQFGSLAALEQQILQILTQLRRSAGSTAGYGAGNLLNIMHQLGMDLTNYNFSNLTVWQADLRSAVLHQVNFTEADLTNTVFAETVNAGVASEAASWNRQYEGMIITGTTGLTDVQKERLKQLGAVD